MAIMGLIRKQYNNWMEKKAFLRDKKLYCDLITGERFELNEEDCIPILTDKNKEAGSVDPHYFLQDIYMAKKVFQYGQPDHYDIGSRIDGFISHLLSSDKIDSVTMLDIRPLSVDIPGLRFIQTDATTLNGIIDNSIVSLSCLHAIEHFGLGRYGDAIDPNAWIKALKSIQEKLAKEGVLFLSAPIGTKEKVCFNAHRIFEPQTIVDALDGLTMKSFAYIHDYQIIESTIEEFRVNGGKYDCGMFVFTK